MTKIGNCVDEFKDGNKCCMKVAEDGRRIKDIVTRRDLDDGTRECVHEELEEVVPMRLAKRTVRKLAEIPIERRVEVYAEDGSVIDTQVEAVDSAALELGHQPPTIEKIAADLAVVKETLEDKKVCTCKHGKKKAKPFLKMAHARYAAPQVEEEIEVRTGSRMETVLTTVGWAVFAVVAGLLTYAVI